MVMYPAFLESDGEFPYYTEYFAVVEEAHKVDTGMTLLEDVLKTEFDKYPGRYTVMPTQLREIVDRADLIYGGREIGAETEESFTRLLIVKVARICPKWEHRFKNYASLTEAELNDLKLTVDGTNETVFQDTPTGDLVGKYATNVTDSTTHTEQTEGTKLASVNANMERYRALVVEFVDEFNDCFMDTTGLM